MSERMRALELRDALDGLFAYDNGTTDSGIHDEALRVRCMAELQSRMSNDGGGRKFMSWLLREMWLSEAALAAGYGYEDMMEFIEWLSDRMDVHLQ